MLGPLRTARPQHGRTSARAAAPLAVAVALGLVSTPVGTASPSRARSARVPGRRSAQLSLLPSAPGGPKRAPRPASPDVSAVAPPVEIAIPVIAVRSRLGGLRLNADDTLQVPSDYQMAGWYRDGTAPGAAGPPAIIVGHVDSATAPGVFFRLRDLQRGDAVLIRRADGTTVEFVVYRLAEYRKASFPATQVYAAGEQPELRLITCTGVFDSRVGHYQDNLVVYAVERSGGPS